jgi:hypothetical protein
MFAMKIKIVIFGVVAVFVLILIWLWLTPSSHSNFEAVKTTIAKGLSSFYS